MKFKYLDHTSEEMFQSFGKTLEEAFGNAALAITNMVVDVSLVKALKTVKFKISAKNLDTLLFDFVDELVFYQDTEGFLVSKVGKLVINEIKAGFVLDCELIGDKSSNYKTHGDVKAPTYNDMFIKKQGKQYVIQMVVDV